MKKENRVNTENRGNRVYRMKKENRVNKGNRASTKKHKSL